tara:strand:- start:2460 stop:3341 length:882 start_codon:yes stop_codon:yes gene_type:complete
MSNKLKKYKIEDCRPSFLGHWIFYMVAALYDIKEFKKKKINVCFDNENFTLIQKETIELLKNRINVLPNDEDFIFVPAVKTRASLWGYFKKINYELIFKKINYELINNYIYFFKLLLKKIFLNDDAFIEKKYFIFLRKLFLEEIKDMSIEGFDKVFIKRKGSENNDGNVADGRLKRRQIINETEIANVATKHGFKVIQLEDFSLKDKIKIFFNAKSIMGANGGGMAFLFMSKPGTKYIEIIAKDPHQWTDHYKQISKLFKLKFFRYDDVKKIDEFDNIIVNPKKFEIYLEQII